MPQHPWLWIVSLFVLPVLGALAVSLIVRKRGLTANGILAWFVIVCWFGALGFILAQVL